VSMSLMDFGKKASVTLARLVACVYTAALLVGPAPWGWGYGPGFISPLIRALPRPLLVIAVFALPYVIPALIAGFIAGRRLGVWAGLLGAMITEGYHHQVFLHGIAWSRRPALAITLTYMLIYGSALYGVPALLGWLGGRLSSRSKAGRALDGWRHWSKVGVVAALLLVYAFTLGKTMALHTVRSRFAGIWPSDASKIRVWSAGVYPAVDGVTGCKGCGFPDTYYTDPTGLVFLYKRNLD